MFTVLEVTLPVFALVFCGFAGAWFKMLPDRAIEGINAFVFWFALPAMLFRVIGLQSIAELVEPRFILGWVCASLSVFLSVAWIAMAGGIDRDLRSAAQSTAFGLSAAHGNVGYLGLALIGELGKQWLPTAALTVLCDILVLIPLAVILFELQTKSGPASAGRLTRIVLMGLIRNPMVMAILVGLIFSIFQIPVASAIDNFTRMLGNAAGPCALFCIGASLGAQRVSVDRTVLALSAAKLILHPLMAALYLFVIFRVSPENAAIGVLLAALPCATGCFILSQRYGMQTRSISATILLGTLAAVVSVSATIWLMGIRV
jgi:malonate transporter and related proteins